MYETNVFDSHTNKYYNTPHLAGAHVTVLYLVVSVSVAEVGGAGSGAHAGGTSGVTLSHIESEVPRLVVLGTPSVVELAGSSSRDLVKPCEESVVSDSGEDKHGGKSHEVAHDGLATLVVHLAGPVADVSEAEVGAGLSLGVEGQVVVTHLGGHDVAHHVSFEGVKKEDIQQKIRYIFEEEELSFKLS